MTPSLGIARTRERMSWEKLATTIKSGSNVLMICWTSGPFTCEQRKIPIPASFATSLRHRPSLTSFNRLQTDLSAGDAQSYDPTEHTSQSMSSPRRVNQLPARFIVPFNSNQKFITACDRQCFQATQTNRTEIRSQKHDLRFCFIVHHAVEVATIFA